MVHYLVFRKDGTEVVKGDQFISFRTGDPWTFESCTHPRKIHVIQKYDPHGDDHWPNVKNMEFYPEVFNLRIEDKTDM